jgi:hypothetical protein
MKKFYMMTVCALAMITAPAAVLAATDTIKTDAAVINNDGAGQMGPATVPVAVSPNVAISLYSTVLGYAMTSTNNLTSVDNGMVYGAHHEATGYAQRAKTAAEVTALAPAAPDAIGLAGITAAASGGTWEWMGGGGS